MRCFLGYQEEYNNWIILYQLNSKLYSTIFNIIKRSLVWWCISLDHFQRWYEEELKSELLKYLGAERKSGSLVVDKRNEERWLKKVKLEDTINSCAHYETNCPYVSYSLCLLAQIIFHVLYFLTHRTISLTYTFAHLLHHNKDSFLFSNFFGRGAFKVWYYCKLYYLS